MDSSILSKVTSEGSSKSFRNLSEVDVEKELAKIIQQKTNEQLNQFSLIYYKKIEKNTPINEL